MSATPATGGKALRLVLDTCVLYPTVMRQMLLGCAAQGYFVPRWSAAILGEWAHTGAKHGVGVLTEGEIAQVRAAWPGALVTVPDGFARRFWLPDPGDLHVLAAAVAASCDGIITLNAKDFPRQVLADEGLTRADPDALMLGFFEARPDGVASVAEAVRAEAERLDGAPWSLRALMKKARLPRLGKALEAAATGLPD